MKNPLLIGMIYMLIEIAVLILVGKTIGVLPTLLLIIATSALGIYLLKKNGTKSFQNIQKSIQQGQPPGVPMIEAFITFLGSIFLIVPGFIANIIGAFMMTSFTRKLFMPAVFFWLRKKMKGNNIVIYQK